MTARLRIAAPTRLAAKAALASLASLALLPGVVSADKLILKDGTAFYGTITDERDSMIK